MKILCLSLWAALLGGCTLINDAGRLGADFDLGLGGGYLASIVGDVHLKTSVAIERRDDNAKGTPADGTGGDRGFL